MVKAAIFATVSWLMFAGFLTATTYQYL